MYTEEAQGHYLAPLFLKIWAKLKTFSRTVFELHQTDEEYHKNCWQASYSLVALLKKYLDDIN